MVGTELWISSTSSILIPPFSLNNILSLSVNSLPRGTTESISSGVRLGTILSIVLSYRNGFFH